MKILLAVGLAVFLSACAAVTERTGLTEVEQICLAREAAKIANVDTTPYDEQLATLGIVCEGF